jgi:hypothetical protein
MCAMVKEALNAAHEGSELNIFAQCQQLEYRNALSEASFFCCQALLSILSVFT